MDTEGLYNIVINIRVPGGMIEVGNFFIGNDPELATETFNELKGNGNIQGSGMLRIDLVKRNTSPPHECLQSISCTLDEYVANCRIITRNAFKFFTMENNGFNTPG
jgi:hypothetical protein